jgi:hypothetical protein
MEESDKILGMGFHKRSSHLINWIAVFAILMSALAPGISQAVSLSQYGQGFSMEICSAAGNKLVIQVQIDDDASQTNSMKSCPYCVAQSTITPAFNTDLTFQVPQTLTLLPQLFYQSPKPLSAWVTPPSAAPPVAA